MNRNRATLIPFALEIVPRAGDREIRMRPIPGTIHARPKNLQLKEKMHV